MGKLSEFTLRLKGMPETTEQHSYRLGRQFFADFGNADILDAALEVSADVTHRHDAYALELAIAGTVTLECDRCLDPLVLPVDARYSVTVEYGDEYSDETDGLLVLPESDDTLDLTLLIHDTVVLSLPMRRVHPDGMCNAGMAETLRLHRAEEIAAPDGDASDDANGDAEETDAPSDPRWDALRGLKPEGDA